MTFPHLNGAPLSALMIKQHNQYYSPAPSGLLEPKQLILISLHN